jgi:hypothetical protein
VVCLASALSFAKPKQKTYNNTPQEVFQAALATARKQHVITYVDEKNLMFTFQTGVSALSYGFIANASVQPEADNKATLIINVQHKNDGKNASFSFNAGDRMADKFYSQVSEELARDASQKVAQKPEASHVDVPPAPVDSSAVTSTSGSVLVTADPSAAEVSVDGNFVGNTPSTLKLPPGKHTIAVSQTGFKTWSRELSVMRGSELKIVATLERQ